LCWNKQVRTDLLDAAVWEDVRSLLAEPERIRVEYERRRQKTKPDGVREVDQVMKLIKQVKKSISRLIDAYEEGLLEKSEFEPRISAARERHSRLEDERGRKAEEESQESELRLMVGRLEEFAKRVSEGLREPDWATRQEIIRALVKQVEIDEGEVRIVYRVSPSPFDRGPQQGRSQHCWGRDQPTTREYLPRSVGQVRRTDAHP
jgi:site-specific DNA recombinase